MSEISKRSMAELQQAEHAVGHDYEATQPHVAHTVLRERICTELSALVRELVQRNGRCRVLEVGGGHGTFTETLVAAGATVTVTEMSEPSAEVLLRRFANSGDVRVQLDADGTFLAESPEHSFDLVVFVSVLHHIPDYLGAIQGAIRALAVGGTLYTVQDPLWYPRRSRSNLAADKLAYFAWRIFRGGYRRGVATRIRRLRRVYDESNPADMVEYHVVRDGVDEEALQHAMAPHFEAVSVWKYWSTQSGLLQRLGHALARPTTFGLKATGRTTD